MIKFKLSKNSKIIDTNFNNNIIVLRYEDGTHWRWNCPNHGGTFTYSKSINRQWGIPEDKVYCAVCDKLYDFEKETEKEN
jgi:hypothetical protein